MFVQGATPGRVDGWSYHEEDEDFTKGVLIPHRICQCLVLFLLDATALDVWVLDQLKSLFRNATTNKELEAQLRAPQVVFFLHLLGLDTTGHSYRPHSKVFNSHAILGT
jgi:phosphatidylinositol glycan class N